MSATVSKTIDYARLVELLDLEPTEIVGTQIWRLRERRREQLEALAAPMKFGESGPTSSMVRAMTELREARLEEIRVIEEALTDARLGFEPQEDEEP